MNGCQGKPECGGDRFKNKAREYFAEGENIAFFTLDELTALLCNTAMEERQEVLSALRTLLDKEKKR